MAEDFDWAAAALSLFRCDSVDLRELVTQAGLDAAGGDLIDLDLSHLDLKGQDLSGWDLQYATFRKTVLSNANFTNTKVDAESLILATDWQSAILDPETREAAKRAFLLKTPLTEFQLAIRTRSSLLDALVFTIGDLIKFSADDLLRFKNFGRRSLSEILELLGNLGLELEKGDAFIIVNAEGKHTKMRYDEFLQVHGTKLHVDGRSPVLGQKVDIDDDLFEPTEITKQRLAVLRDFPGKDEELLRRYGALPLSSFRRVYGPRFAAGFGPAILLGSVLPVIDPASLQRLFIDYSAGTLQDSLASAIAKSPARPKRTG